MQFKDIQENSPIYILYKKEGLIYKKGRVVKRSSPYFPKYDPSQYSYMRQPNLEQLVDISVEIEGHTEQIPPVFINREFASNEELTISCSVDAIRNEIECRYEEANNILNNIEKYKRDIKACEEIKLRLDPSYAESRAKDEKIDKLTNELEEMKGMLKELMSGRQPGAESKTIKTK